MTAIALLSRDTTNTCAISLLEDWWDAWFATDPLGNPAPLDGIDFVTVVRNASGNAVLTLSISNGFHQLLAGTAVIGVTQPGVGYAVGDTIALAGGTFDTPAVLKVLGVTPAGGILSAQMVTPGLYEALPQNPVLPGSTTGAGTGAAFALTWVRNALGYLVPQASLPKLLKAGTYTFTTIATADGQTKLVTTMTMTVS